MFKLSYRHKLKYKKGAFLFLNYSCNVGYDNKLTVLHSR